MLCKNIFGRNIYVHSKFSCVRSSHGLCARAHTHSLEGTLVMIRLQCRNAKSLMIKCALFSTLSALLLCKFENLFTFKFKFLSASLSIEDDESAATLFYIVLILNNFYSLQH